MPPIVIDDMTAFVSRCSSNLWVFFAGQAEAPSPESPAQAAARTQMKPGTISLLGGGLRGLLQPWSRASKLPQRASASDILRTVQHFAEDGSFSLKPSLWWQRQRLLSLFAAVLLGTTSEQQPQQQPLHLNSLTAGSFSQILAAAPRRRPWPAPLAWDAPDSSRNHSIAQTRSQPDGGRAGSSSLH